MYLAEVSEHSMLLLLIQMLFMLLLLALFPELLHHRCFLLLLHLLLPLPVILLWGPLVSFCPVSYPAVPFVSPVAPSLRRYLKSAASCLRSGADARMGTPSLQE